MRETLSSLLGDPHEVERRMQETIENGFTGERGVRFHIKYRLGVTHGSVVRKAEVPSGATDVEEIQVGDNVGSPVVGLDGKKYQEVHTHKNPTGYAGSIPVKLVPVNGG